MYQRPICISIKLYLQINFSAKLPWNIYIPDILISNEFETTLFCIFLAGQDDARAGVRYRGFWAVIRINFCCIFLTYGFRQNYANLTTWPALTHTFYRNIFSEVPYFTI